MNEISGDRQEETAEEGKRAEGEVADGGTKASAYYHDHVQPAFDISITRFRIEVTSNSMPVLCPPSPPRTPFVLCLLPPSLPSYPFSPSASSVDMEARPGEEKRGDIAGRERK